MIKQNRSILLDIVKYLAAVLVIYGHVLVYSESRFDQAMSFIVNISHMPVFFFVSGYFFVSEIQKYPATELIRKKTFRLVLPYLLWSSLALCMNIVLLWCDTHALSIAAVLTEAKAIFLYARSAWFLIELFFSTLLLIGCSQVAKWTHISIYPISLVCYLLVYLLDLDTLFAVYKIRWLFPSMILGYAWKDRAERIVPRTRYVRYLAFPLLVRLSKLAFGYQYPEDLFYSVYTIAPAMIGKAVLYQLGSCLGIIAIFSVADLLERLPCRVPLADRGTFSLDSYLIHMFFLKLLTFLSSLTLPAPIKSLIFMLIACLLFEVIYHLCRLILRRIWLYRISLGILPTPAKKSI